LDLVIEQSSPAAIEALARYLPVTLSSLPSFAMRYRTSGSLFLLFLSLSFAPYSPPTSVGIRRHPDEAYTASVSSKSAKFL
jgi:hypothetical protein